MTDEQLATARETAALYGLEPDAATMERIAAYADGLGERYRAGHFGGAILWAPVYHAAHVVCTNVTNGRREDD